MKSFQSAQLVKNLPAMQILIPGWGRSPGKGKDYPLQCSCLENPRDRGAWWAAVYGVAQSWTRLKRLSSNSPSQGMFATKGSNPGLPHCRRILYCLSHQGSPRILEWVAYPFSSGSSQSRDGTRVSCIAGGFFTS